MPKQKPCASRFTAKSVSTARKFSRPYRAGSMKTLPTMKAQKVARPKKKMLSPATPRIVTSTPTGSKPPYRRDTSTISTPVTA